MPVNNRDWHELLPFYVCGELSAQETAALEQQLARDPELQQALFEWQVLADVVRDTASDWAAEPPPLSADFKARLRPQDGQATQPHNASANGGFTARTVSRPKPSAPPAKIKQFPRQESTVQAPRPAEPTQDAAGYFRTDETTKGIRVPLAGIAAAIVTLFVVGFLLTIVLGTDDTSTTQSNVKGTPTLGMIVPGAGVVSNPTPTPTITLLPTDTDNAGILDTSIPAASPTQPPFPSQEPAVPIAPDRPQGGGNAPGPDIQSLPVETATILPDRTSNAVAAPALGDTCRVSAPADADAEDSITIFASPNGAELNREIEPGETWWVKTILHNIDWLEVVAPDGSGVYGWVESDAVQLAGDCNQIPAPTPTQSANTAQCTAIGGSAEFPSAVAIYGLPDESTPPIQSFANMTVIGRFEDGDWLRITGISQQTGSIYVGFVLRSGVSLYGNCSNLPIVTEETMFDVDASMFTTPAATPLLPSPTPSS